MDHITEKIIGCAIEVHRHLGPGLLESAYEECLCYELKNAGLRFVRQKGIPVIYKSIKLDYGYRMDILVESEIIIELKTVEALHPVHHAQLLTYMKFSRKSIGLLINFNVLLLKKRDQEVQDLISPTLIIILSIFLLRLIGRITQRAQRTTEVHREKGFELVYFSKSNRTRFSYTFKKTFLPRINALLSLV
jgi:GxxExxY protein